MSSPAPSHDAAGFARDVRAIGDACTAVLAQLDEALVAQRRGVLALAAVAGIDERTAAALSRATLGPEPGLRAPVVTSADAADTAIDPNAETAPTLATAAIYQSAALSISLAFHNAVAAQQMLGVLAQAIVAQGAAKILARPASEAPPSRTE